MKKTNKFIFWTPRILSIVFILFLSLFSLDVFDGTSSFFETLLALFMHNIPSLVLLIFLLISLKYEIVGGIGYILAGILYVIFTILGAPEAFLALSWSIIIAGPAFFIGTLFLIGWFKKKRFQVNKTRV
ncbi:hypothetical protein KKC94_05595 [Patescibacteria group bacterium]|nr:hypothetical protein [Patescibacteria group bacterium]